MKIAILLGSVRQGRRSHRIAHYLETVLAKQAVRTDLIDLGTDSLPIYGQDEARHRQAISDIGKRLEMADALLLVTPEYHGSFSGALKNALDYFWAEFQRKPIGVVAVSSGRLGGINASNQLQQVVLSLGGVALPVKWVVPEIQNAFDEDGRLQDGTIAIRAEKFVTEYLWYADAIYQKKSAAQHVTKGNGETSLIDE
ncbi:NAD(P)H-dependent FMN reductase [Parapedobacter composti]|uniref:NAD(P)H-dependent FMN reductase n=1 Tax=Parapedobacter composti TaxID=623281 RepID=A0A1I1LS25_9SPHI|nr:NAD(P)H-dependent oxidoreductase [Parapedobacter composti]SFC75785.1 NAD(P)H-dependent FMN reductase [Parapedobacter composti]